MLTEWTRIHEVPESIIPVPTMTWPWNDFRKNGTGEVDQDLKEQRGDGNDLGTELLNLQSSISLARCDQ
jgi:hypothetical protein